MVILYALEFIEGNTITRLYFMRLRRLARAALAEERVIPQLTRAHAKQLASFTHFLDIPLLLVIVSLGALRPSDWTQFVIGTVIAVAAASLLNYFIPRLYPWDGEDAQPTHSARATLGQTEASKAGLAMSGPRPIADLSCRGRIGRRVP
jgi:hypothetical protein